MRTENQPLSLNNLLQHLLELTEYADQLMAATENLELPFPVEKVRLLYILILILINATSRKYIFTILEKYLKF